MKIISTAFLVLALIPTSVRGGDLPFTGTLYVKGVSEYLADNGDLVDKTPDIQGGLTIGWGKGYSLDFWGSYPFNGQPGAGKEFDLTFCKDTDLNKSWSTGACLAWYHLTPKGFGDFIAPQVSLTKKYVLNPLHTISVLGKIEWFIPTKKVPSWGVLPKVQITHSWNIEGGPFTLNHGPMMVLDPGAFGNDSTVVGGYEGNLTILLEDHLRLQLPTIKWVRPMTEVKDNRRHPHPPAVGLKLSWDF